MTGECWSSSDSKGNCNLSVLAWTHYDRNVPDLRSLSGAGPDLCFGPRNVGRSNRGHANRVRFVANRGHIIVAPLKRFSMTPI